MAQMAEISNMQAALAHRVQASMARIDSMMHDPAPAASSSMAVDEGDADAWREKIFLLSAPVPNTDSMFHDPAPAAPSSTSMDEGDADAWREKILLLSAPVVAEPSSQSADIAINRVALEFDEARCAPRSPPTADEPGAAHLNAMRAC